MAEDKRQRLLKGARVLGDFWRSGERCQSGWSSECSCEQKTKFCKAKAQWIDLAVQDALTDPTRPEVVIGEQGLALSMRASEWDATKLTMKCIEPELIVGPKATVSMRDLVKMMDAPDDSDGVLKLMSIFKGCKVERVEKPKEALK